MLPSSPKDIVAVCEKFLSSYSPMSMFEVPMIKSVSLSRKLNAQGEQVICIRQDWSFRVEEDLCEMLFVEIIPMIGDSLKFGSVYRAPSSIPKKNFKVFESVLLKLSESKQPVIISGNFNFDLLNLDLSTHREFLNIILWAGFLPSISLPTRVTNNTATLIDNIYIFFLLIQLKH